jgi:hypothetical protein
MGNVGGMNASQMVGRPSFNILIFLIRYLSENRICPATIQEDSHPPTLSIVAVNTNPPAIQENFQSSKSPVVAVNTGAPGFPTTLHVYYAVARALLRGDPRTQRPPIPVELVLLIFGSVPRKILSTEFTVRHSGRRSFSARSLPRGCEYALWFHSAPVTRRFLSQVVETRLTTDAEGLGSDQWIAFDLCQYIESPTGFAIGILRPLGDGPEQNDTDATKIKLKFHDSSTSYTPVPIGDGDWSWLSHDNVRFRRSVVRGKVFGPNHQMWGMLKEGDVICVYALAQRSSVNHVISGRLVTYEKFDPTRILKGTT